MKIMREMTVLSLCCGLMVGVPAMADEAGAARAVAAEQKVDRLINGNLFGIQSIKKDGKGRIVSVVSIGRAPVTTALTKARAKNQAFKRADAAARAEFMKWLTTAVVYTRIDDESVAILQKGASQGDAGSGVAGEQAQAEELSQEQIVSVAAGFVKGMVQVGAGINEDGEAVVILGWSASTAKQMDSVRDANTPKPVAKKVKVDTPAKPAAPAQGAVTAPAVRTSVSAEAGDFL